jgi:hypothetical protein
MFCQCMAVQGHGVSPPGSPQLAWQTAIGKRMNKERCWVAVAHFSNVCLPASDTSFLQCLHDCVC